MRKTRSFVAIVTVLLTCLLATACGNGNVVATGGQEKESVDTESISIGVEAQLAGVEVIDHTGEEIDNDALPDIDVDGGAVWTDSNPESVPEPEPEPEVLEPEPEPEVLEPEPETEPESVIPEPEPEPEPEYQNPGTHSGYLNVVGDARFYTEHDINQWLRQDSDNPDYTDFDIEQMLIDLWCQDGGGLIENNVGYSFTDGEEWTKGIWFEASDADHENAFHMVTILYSVNGKEYTTPIRIYEYPWPFLNHCKDYYFVLDQYYKYIHKDMAPLILLAIERMEANPHDGVLNDLNLNENFYCD